MLRGLTRGLGATMAREVPGNALFFTAYEALRRVVAMVLQLQIVLSNPAAVSTLMWVSTSWA